MAYSRKHINLSVSTQPASFWGSQRKILQGSPPHPHPHAIGHDCNSKEVAVGRDCLVLAKQCSRALSEVVKMRMCHEGAQEYGTKEPPTETQKC